MFFRLWYRQKDIWKSSRYTLSNVLSVSNVLGIADVIEDGVYHWDGNYLMIDQNGELLEGERWQLRAVSNGAIFDNHDPKLNVYSPIGTIE